MGPARVGVNGQAWVDNVLIAVPAASTSVTVYGGSWSKATTPNTALFPRSDQRFRWQVDAADVDDHRRSASESAKAMTRTV